MFQRGRETVEVNLLGLKAVKCKNDGDCGGRGYVLTLKQLTKSTAQCLAD